MRKKIIISILCFLLVSHAAFAEAINLDQEKSRINYSLTCLGIPIKKKFLPVSGAILLDGQNLFSLNLKANFTSKNPLFRKVINYDKYPFFSFSTEFTDPVQLKIGKDFELPGYISFHGIKRQINVNLEKEIENNFICLKGLLSIKMTDFEIKPPKILFIPIDDIIKVKFELYAINKAEKL